MNAENNHSPIEDSIKGEIIPQGDLGQDFPSLPIKDKRTRIKDTYGLDELKKFDLKTINTLTNNGYTDLEISGLLSIAPGIVSRYRAEIRKRMAKELQDIDSNTFIGERMSFYRNLAETAARNIAKYQNNPHVQRHFIDLALRAETELHKFLEGTGFYEYRKYDPGVSGYDGATDASDIKRVLSSILKGEEFSATVEDEPQEDIGI